MNIGIIGGGWFGCHIAFELKKIGINPTLLEKESKLFQMASGNNTGRLHQGFHYPRSKQTRLQNIAGFQEFKKTYPDFLFSGGKSLYAIANKNSLIDWETYLDILNASGLDYEIVSCADYGLQNLSGAFNCAELFINSAIAENYFTRELQANTRFNYTVEDIQLEANAVLVNQELRFDYLIDCSYGAITKFKEQLIKYEIVQMLKFKQTNPTEAFSYVVMDGDFQAISPYGKEVNKHLLYDAELSILKQTDNILEAQHYLKEVQTLGETKHLQEILDKAHHFNPKFSQQFTFEESIFSLRTTIDDKSDTRKCIVEQENRLIAVLSGKINSIFDASREVIALLER